MRTTLRKIFNAQKLFSFFSTYRIKSLILSFLFGAVIILLYYTLHWIIPEAEYSEQIVPLLFIIISVLILFPARENILRKILKDSEYSFFFGKDSHHLDLIARHFTMDTLVWEIFPELMDWLEVRNGRLAILESDKKHYFFYTYKKRNVHKKESAYYSIIEENVEYLSRTPHLIYRMDSPNPDSLIELMEKFRAEVIQPIVYRKTLVGFLILNEIPLHKYSQRALEIFADKAALSIHTNILSGRVADMVKYDQEFQTAARISRLLHNTALPEIPGYHVQNLRPGNILALTEIFKAADDRWYLVIVHSARVVGAAGLILAGILGHLYSLIHREEPVTLHRLNNHIRKDAGLNRDEFKMDILIAEFNLRENAVVVIPDFNFNITDVPANEKLKINKGWRNNIFLGPDIPYRINYGRTPLIEITRESNSAKSKGQKRAVGEMVK